MTSIRIKKSLPAVNIGEQSVDGDVMVKFSYDVSLKDRVIVSVKCEYAGDADIIIVRKPFREPGDDEWELPVVGLRTKRQLFAWDLEVLEKFIHVINVVYSGVHQVWVTTPGNELQRSVHDKIDGIVSVSNFTLD